MPRSRATMPRSRPPSDNGLSKSGWVSLKSRIVVRTLGRPSRGAVHGCQAPSAHVSVPTPQTVEQPRVTAGTWQGPSTPSAQVSVPSPHTVEHALVTTGTRQAPTTPLAQVAVPSPHAL